MSLRRGKPSDYPPIPGVAKPRLKRVKALIPPIYYMGTVWQCEDNLAFERDVAFDKWYDDREREYHWTLMKGNRT